MAVQQVKDQLAQELEQLMDMDLFSDMAQLVEPPASHMGADESADDDCMEEDRDEEGTEQGTAEVVFG